MDLITPMLLAVLTGTPAQVPASKHEDYLLAQMRPMGELTGNHECYDTSQLRQSFVFDQKTLFGKGTKDNGEAHELWINANGEFTLVITLPGMPALCVLATGKLVTSK